MGYRIELDKSTGSRLQRGPQRTPNNSQRHTFNSCIITLTTPCVVHHDICSPFGPSRARTFDINRDHKVSIGDNQEILLNQSRMLES